MAIEQANTTAIIDAPTMPTDTHRAISKNKGTRASLRGTVCERDGSMHKAGRVAQELCKLVEAPV